MLKYPRNPYLLVISAFMKILEGEFYITHPFTLLRFQKFFFVKEKSKQHWCIEMYSASIISCASGNFAQNFHLLVK